MCTYACCERLFLTMLRLPSLSRFYCVFFILFVLCMHVGVHIHAITHWEVRVQLTGVSSLLPLHDFPVLNKVNPFGGKLLYPCAITWAP